MRGTDQQGVGGPAFVGGHDILDQPEHTLYLTLHEDQGRLTRSSQLFDIGEGLLEAAKYHERRAHRVAVLAEYGRAQRPSVTSQAKTPRGIQLAFDGGSSIAYGVRPLLPKRDVALPEANGAQRAYAARAAGATIRETYGESVAETRRTYVPEGVSTA